MNKSQYNPQLNKIGKTLQQLCLEIGTGQIKWDEAQKTIKSLKKELEATGLQKEAQDLEETLAAISNHINNET